LIFEDPAYMNLKQLDIKAKRPRVGDVFRMNLPSKGWLWGRVVAIDAKCGSMENCTMLYIYSSVHKSKNDKPVLSPPKLLIGPVLTNNRLFSMKYAEIVENVSITTDQRLAKNQFKSPFGDTYYDEYNNVITPLPGPCGDRGLGSYRTLDDQVSEALGVPLAPD
jgi:hypothetical protein